MFFSFAMNAMNATYYQILKELVAMKSISVNTEYTDDIEKISLYLNGMLQDNGFISEIIHGYGNPIILGRFSVDKSFPTMLLYGHYDVQTVWEEWWKNDPFSLYITQEKIYGRGVSDNKWQFLIHLLTLFDLIHSKKLWYNVIVLLEGNKETWSQYMEQFLMDYRQDLLSDFCLISDWPIIWDTPCIDVGYRWWVNVYLKISTATTNLHAWWYGGIVPNALHEMNKILGKLYDMNNKITIPYFYYDVEDVDTEILVRNKRMKLDEKKIMEHFWIKTLFKDKDIDLITQIWLRPTIQVTWISWWYIGKEYKHAIPNVAYAYINFRIVKNQTTRKVIWAFEQRLQTTLPSYVAYELEIDAMYEPVKIDMNNLYVKKAEIVLEQIFSKKVFYKYSWGWLPIVDMLDKVLWIKSVLVPLANEDCGAHGHNENFDNYLIEKWFQFAYEFFKK